MILGAQEDTAAQPRAAKPLGRPVPRGAEPVTAMPVQTRQPVPPSPSKPVTLTPRESTAKPAEPFGKSRALTAYEYAVSKPELERLRESNPTAAGTIMTEVRAAPMTWKEYDSLTSDQRAAVDFNTLLVDAREADLNEFAKSYTQDAIKGYQGDVERMFGKDGGSDKIAMNTVNLLKSLDFSAVGQDLDEFLSLERAVSVDELGDFKFSKAAAQNLTEFDMKIMDEAVNSKDNPQGNLQLDAQGKPVDYFPRLRETLDMPQAEANDEEMARYAAVRTPANIAAIDTKLIQSALDAFKTQLAAPDGNQWDIMAALDSRTFRWPSEKPVGYGRGSDNPDAAKKLRYKRHVDNEINNAYNMLMANPNKQGLQALEIIFKDGEWTPQDKQMLWDYINNRTLTEIQYRNDAGSRVLRDLLGWE